VTSAIRAEGKSLVSANLAAALGEQGIACIIVSCDLRSPTIHRYFDVPDTPGVTEALASWDGQPGFRRILRSTRAPNVSVIPGGTPSRRPAALLASEDFRRLIKHARAEAEVVIIDTPAILLSGDAVPQLVAADAVLLVARIGRTTIEAAERASETLDRLGAHVIGFALNGSRSVGSPWRRSGYRVVTSTMSEGASELAGARAGGKA
jgi:capsular exopolysaccharide synthesis family protein